jgi:peptidoglycan/LPS O-acetylase OafA/YrhL
MSSHIKSLTSLRGIAAIAVVIHHFAYSIFPTMGLVVSAYSGFFRHGYLWVDFFFMLSGFVMTHVYHQSFVFKVTATDYFKYLRSRFARIYPLHLFMLLLFVGLEFFKLFQADVHAFTEKFNLTALFANVVLLQAFDLSCPPLFWCNTYWNEPAWSVSVEFVIYCLFPFGLFVLSKIKQKFNLLIYLITLALLFLLIKFTRGTLDSIIGVPAIARCGLECMMGMVIYQVYQQGDYRKYLNLNLLATISICWIFGLMNYWNDKFRTIHDWLVLPGFSLLILAVSTQTNSWISRLLSSRSMVYLGTISYSIYLVHWFVAELLKIFWLYQFQIPFSSVAFNNYESLLAIGLFATMTILLSSLVYQFVEAPMRNYLKSLAQP